MAKGLQCLATKSKCSGPIFRCMPICGLAWSLYKCAALWRAIYDPSVTERPLCEEGKFPPDATGNSSLESSNVVLGMQEIHMEFWLLSLFSVILVV